MLKSGVDPAILLNKYKSGFVRETLDIISKVDRDGWAVLVAEKKL